LLKVERSTQRPGWKAPRQLLRRPDRDFNDWLLKVARRQLMAEPRVQEQPL